MMNEEREALSSALRGMTSGFSELLATALGNARSVAKTIEGLASSALEQGHHGAAISPSLVSQRVDALAAHDEDLLVDIARTWKPIDELSIVEQLDTDYWLTAWTTALRFVASPMRLGPQKLHGAPYMIAREGRAVF